MRVINPAFVSLLIALALGSGHVDATESAYRNAIRDFLIVKHCGLNTYEVSAGFRIEIIGLIGDGKVLPHAGKIDREAAAEEVRRDWRNRGMGHADPRCLTKGRAAVDHFLAVLNAEE